MNKLYSRIRWENYPSEKTPLNESNLNKIDNAVDALDDRAIEIDTKKLDVMTANTMVRDVSVNSSNGIITVTYLNGAKATFDTLLEKIAVNFVYDSSAQKIILTLSDGTKQYVDLSTLITEYEFEDGDTILFEAVSGKVKAKIKKGSITDDMLNPDYLSEITTAAGKADKVAKETLQVKNATEAVRADVVMKLANGDFTGKQGSAGPQGPTGPKGDGGVAALTSGMFYLQLDGATGDLYACYPDGDSPPQFEYDGTTGDLYYVIP